MFYSALVLGFLGSLHCFAMCGPLSLLLPNNADGKLKYFTGRLIYNFGRIFTYTLLGLLVGAFGEQIMFYVPQKIVFLTLGFLLLIYVLLPQRTKLLLAGSTFSSSLNRFVKKGLSKFSKQKSLIIPNLAFGLVNGLLPCGLVYAALSGAFLAANTGDSALYMLFFGLGTLPMMLSFGFLGSYINRHLKLKPTFIYTFSYLILGGFMLYKGYKSQNMLKSSAEEITVCYGQ